VRDTIFKGRGGGRNIFSPVLKVPRQCPLVLPIEVCLRVGNALGTLEGLHVNHAVQSGIWVPTQHLL
jgi:hypothetical protein